MRMYPKKEILFLVSVFTGEEIKIIVGGILSPFHMAVKQIKRKCNCLLKYIYIKIGIYTLPHY